MHTPIQNVTYTNHIKIPTQKKILKPKQNTWNPSQNEARPNSYICTRGDTVQKKKKKKKNPKPKILHPVNTQKTTNHANTTSHPIIHKSTPHHTPNLRPATLYKNTQTHLKNSAHCPAN